MHEKVLLIFGVAVMGVLRGQEGSEHTALRESAGQHWNGGGDGIYL